MKRTVLLIDMDGVLVEPKRYRAALQATIDFFGSKMGWDSLYPGESTVAWFESQGIISEWDIAPLYLASVFETILNIHDNLVLSSDLIESCQVIKTARIQKPEIKVEKQITYAYSRSGFGTTICDTIFKQDYENSKAMIFSKLAAQPVFASILLNTRVVQKNLITRVFQEMFLGRSDFQDSFGIPVITKSQPASRLIDKQLISADWIRNLNDRNFSSGINTAIYTARPSLQKNFGLDNGLFLSPEADIVVRQLGLTEVPLVGQGQLFAAAEKIGCTPDKIIKPSPVHALGAIGAALGETILQAIIAGWNLANKIEEPLFDKFADLNIHIFEDSPTGIHGVDMAAEILKARGIKINVAKWGITSDPSKEKSLIAKGAKIRPSINSALTDALR